MSYAIGDAIEIVSIDMNDFDWKELCIEFINRNLDKVYARKCKGIGIVLLNHFDDFYVKCRNRKNGLQVMNQISVILNGMMLTNNNEEIDTDNILFLAVGSFDKIAKTQMEVISRAIFNRSKIGKDVMHCFSSIVNMEKLGFEETYQIYTYCDRC